MQIIRDIILEYRKFGAAISFNNAIKYCFLLNSNLETKVANNFHCYINSKQYKDVPQIYLKYGFDILLIFKVTTS